MRLSAVVMLALIRGGNSGRVCVGLLSHASCIGTAEVRECNLLRHHVIVLVSESWMRLHTST